jgi:hypothetical protein
VHGPAKDPVPTSSNPASKSSGSSVELSFLVTGPLPLSCQDFGLYVVVVDVDDRDITLELFGPAPNVGAEW